jgi:hypothetical protein
MAGNRLAVHAAARYPVAVEVARRVASPARSARAAGVIRSESRTQIGRPVPIVYGFVVEEFFDNYPRWSPEVTELEGLDTPCIALGNRVRQVRLDRGRRSETTVCVSSLSPHEHAEFTSEHAPWFRIRFDFAPTGSAATELAFSFELQRVELYMRPFTKLIRRALQEGADRSVEEIRRMVETER